MSAANASPFNPRVVLAMLLVGALAFIGMLYFIGVGEPNRGTNDGGSHAASKGINGYAALVELLKDEGHNVRVTRNRGQLDGYDLLIITPPHYIDPEDLDQLLTSRQYQGPTLVILPKWFAYKVRPGMEVEDAEDGWVVLGGSGEPNWLDDLERPEELTASVEEVSKQAAVWSGLGMSGSLPDHEHVMGMKSNGLFPLVTGGDGRMLAGYIDDNGYYPELDDAAGRQREQPAETYDEYGYEYDYENYESTNYAVVFVAEPDLFNNYGMADADRAALALRIVELAMEGEDLDITFDLTMNGLGQQQNLLTLAFTPPFLAATLCLILAMIVVAWRAFRRFGPPLAEQRAIAFGKSRLVANSAAFIQRTGRIRLLTAPYAELIAHRIAKLLGLRRADPEEIDEVLRRRAPDTPSFAESARTLRSAKSKHETLRAARALKDIERTLKR